MSLLRLEFKKHSDGTVTLACHRQDGTSTWQRPKSGQAGFFVLHDLTHLAVETELGDLAGFFRLIADGWDISDFGPPWPRGPLPASAAFVELVVGLLDTERASAARWTSNDFNKHVANHRDARGLEQAMELTDKQLQRIRHRRSELFAKWSALEPGDRLDLEFG